MDIFDIIGYFQRLNLFYTVKPFIPRSLQILLRRKIAQRKRQNHNHVWPISRDAANPPAGWEGWPEGKKFALVLTHDVEGTAGVNKVHELVELEKEYGLASSFNFVPKRYDAPQSLLRYLNENGFEIGVHGLYHDGKLYQSKHVFKKRAEIINNYLEEWGAVGFRAPSMHHKLSWNCLLDIEYDASTFDTDPFEPQSDGIGSIFPVFIDSCDINLNGDFADRDKSGYVELPYTLIQDFTLFILLKEKNIDIWKMKLDWLVRHGGMALINTHPDYMNFENREDRREEYPVEYYREFLDYVTNEYADQYWHALPRDVALFTKNKNEVKDSP